MSRLVIAAALMVAVSGIAHGDASDKLTTVQDLLNDCTDSVKLTNQISCIGYIGGVGDVMILNSTVLGHPVSKEMSDLSLQSLCSDDVPTHGAMVQAFKNWAQKHPEFWGKSEALGAVVAIAQTWPCK